MAKKQRTTRTVKPPLEDDTLKNALALSTGRNEGKTLRRITSIAELLQDEETMILIASDAASGASISSIEMGLGFPPGMMKGWLRSGAKEDHTSLFNAFYRFFMVASAEATKDAEANLLKKNPSAWLQRNHPLTQLEIPIDNEPPTVEGSVQHGVVFKEFND